MIVQLLYYYHYCIIIHAHMYNYVTHTHTRTRTRTCTHARTHTHTHTHTHSGSSVLAPVKLSVCTATRPSSHPMTVSSIASSTTTASGHLPPRVAVTTGRRRSMRPWPSLYSTAPSRATTPASLRMARWVEHVGVGHTHFLLLQGKWV